MKISGRKGTPGRPELGIRISYSRIQRTVRLCGGPGQVRGTFQHATKAEAVGTERHARWTCSTGTRIWKPRKIRWRHVLCCEEMGTGPGMLPREATALWTCFCILAEVIKTHEHLYHPWVSLSLRSSKLPNQCRLEKHVFPTVQGSSDVFWVVISEKTKTL